MCRLHKGGDEYDRIFITIYYISFCWSSISNYHNYCLNNCTCTYIKQKIKITKKQLLLMIVLIILMLLFQTFFGILKSQSMKKLFDNVWDGYDSIFIFFSIIIIFLIA